MAIWIPTGKREQEKENGKRARLRGWVTRILHGMRDRNPAWCAWAMLGLEVFQKQNMMMSQARTRLSWVRSSYLRIFYLRLSGKVWTHWTAAFFNLRERSEPHDIWNSKFKIQRKDWFDFSN